MPTGRLPACSSGTSGSEIPAAPCIFEAFPKGDASFAMKMPPDFKLKNASARLIIGTGKGLSPKA